MAEPTYAQYLAVLADELNNDTHGWGPFVNLITNYHPQANTFNIADQLIPKTYFDSLEFQKLIDADDFDSLPIGRRDYWNARIASAEPFTDDLQTSAAFTADFGGTTTDANQSAAQETIRRIDQALLDAGYTTIEPSPTHSFPFTPTGADITEAWAI